MKKVFLVFLSGVLLFSCSQLPAPTDEDIVAFQASIVKHDGGGDNQSDWEQMQNDSIDAAFAKWDIMQASLDQINAISKGGILYKNQHLRALVYPRLLELAKENTLDGANAKSISIVNFPMDPDLPDEENQLNWARAYIEFADHPALDAYMHQEGYGSTAIFGRLQFLDHKAVVETGLLHKLVPLLDMEMGPMLASTAVQLFDEASDPELGFSADSIEIVRVKALKLTEQAKEFYLNAEENKSRRTRLNYIDQITAFLSGPFAKGSLMGNVAPEVPFYWCSDGKTKSLADWKGKVVIVDFWATWCGPCVGAFPNVRKLQERYKDYNVEIVGVTAVQGYHFDRKNNERIRLPDDPETEMEMMRGFMEDFDMTWKVAFSDEEFNPDFGVRGIPHVAIIDTEGKVRFNMLRPYEPPYHEAEKIDALLKEAGLPYPSEPMEKTNWGHE